MDSLALDLPNPIDFPSPQFATFELAAAAAIEEARPLRLAAEVHVVLTESFHMKQSSGCLYIVGSPGVVAAAGSAGRPIIEGSGHCVFHVAGRKAKLVLQNIDLRHTCDRPDKRDIGAAVFVMKKTVASLRGCSVSSANGFCVWAVQTGHVELEGCAPITAASRSGCVVFGSAELSLTECRLVRCAQHAVCIRGRSRLRLRGCEISDCGVRGVYAYNNVAVDMLDCAITGTASAAHAAVDFYSSADGAPASKWPLLPLSLRMQRCTVSDNAGVGLRGVGCEGIQRQVEDCRFERNAGGGQLWVSAETEAFTAITHEHSGEAAGGDGGSSGSAGARCYRGGGGGGDDELASDYGGGKGGGNSGGGGGAGGAASSGEGGTGACEEVGAEMAELAAWEFEVDDSASQSGVRGWRSYDAVSSRLLEQGWGDLQAQLASTADVQYNDAELATKAKIALRIGGVNRGVEYECDLLHLEQTNLATFHSRKIRRAR
jgi:hypothetical protein